MCIINLILIVILWAYKEVDVIILVLYRRKVKLKEDKLLQGPQLHNNNHSSHYFSIAMLAFMQNTLYPLWNLTLCSILYCAHNTDEVG